MTKRLDAQGQKIADSWKETLHQITDVSNETDSTNVFYDKWAVDYDTCMIGWGYNVPQMCLSLMRKYSRNCNKSSSPMNILDCGSGTGLNGRILLESYSDITCNLYGIDISQVSIDIALKRNVYYDIKKHNLELSPYPYNDNKFDVILCTGVLTYCFNKELIFNEWLRILKPNGLIIVSHRTDHMYDLPRRDIKIFNKFVNDKKWINLEHTEPTKYLPGNEHYGDKVLVESYVARSCKTISQRSKL